MTTLDQIAKVIRSKNAGPFFVTLDILFSSEADYNRVLAANVIERDNMARLYKQPLDKVSVYHHRAALAMKVTIVRPVPAASIHDTDIYGAQKHVLLYPLEIP